VAGRAGLLSVPMLTKLTVPWYDVNNWPLVSTAETVKLVNWPAVSVKPIGVIRNPPRGSGAATNSENCDVSPANGSLSAVAVALMIKPGAT